MKTSLLLLLAALTAPVAFTSAFAQTETTPPPAASASSQADRDYAAAWAIWKTPPATPDLYHENPRAFFTWQDRQMQAFSAAARAFTQKYPQDHRRYELLVQSSFTAPSFITGFKPAFAANPNGSNLTVDDSATTAWRASQLGYLAEVITAPDADERERGGATYAYLVTLRLQARQSGRPLDLAPLGALVDRVLASMPDARALPVVDQYQQALNEQSPVAAKAFATRLQALPSLAAAIAAANARRADAAAAQLKKFGALAELKFTAADGREVDLAKLRGKVVLIDFWATWCGPCKAEIPNVVANYDRYHTKGFDVIGITLESKPGDKAKMLAFTRANHMPWPQYFDGLGWKNVIARRFGIDEIPAMVLLDQNGKVVSTEARGPALEAELKRLLAL